jgi:hypothetical protein
MNMPGLAAAYAMLGTCAGTEVATAAGLTAKAGASRRAHELEPMTERLARVGACERGWGGKELKEVGSLCLCVSIWRGCKCLRCWLAM